MQCWWFKGHLHSRMDIYNFSEPLEKNRHERDETRWLENVKQTGYLFSDLMSCSIFLAQNFLFINAKGFFYIVVHIHLYTCIQWRKSIRRVKYKKKIIWQVRHYSYQFQIMLKKQILFSLSVCQFFLNLH